MSTSCNEIGTVKKLMPDGRAVVVIRRAEACHSCVAKGACQTLGGQTKDMTLVLANDLGAKPGDEVTLTLAEGSVIKASAVLYLLPAVGLVGGATLGWRFAADLGLGLDPASIIGAAVGLLVGFGATKLVSSKMSKQEEYTPHLTSIRTDSPS